jgi:hypothetical protein
MVFGAAIQADPANARRDVDTRTRSVDLHRKGRPRVLRWPGTGLPS